MKVYICINCAFSTTIKNKSEKCPICNNEFTQLTNRESNTFLNLKGDQRIKWIESKIGHSISKELNELRENYKQNKIQQNLQKNEYEQKMKKTAALEHGKAILQEKSRTPKCPSCGSSNISKVGVVSRAVSFGLVGFASSKIGKTHKCNNCGSMW